MRSILALVLLLVSVAAAQARELSVVYNAGVAPLKFEDSQGRPAGILPDIWRRWAEQSGHSLRFIRTETFNESLDMVREGRADLNAGLFRTPEREAFLEFSEPVFTLNYYIFTHPSLQPTSRLEDLQGVVVGVAQGGFTRDLVGSVVPEHLIREFPGNEELYLAALRGEIRAFVSTDVALLYFLDQNRLANSFGFDSNAPLSSQAYCAAASKGQTELIAEVNAGLARIGSNEREALQRRWLASGVRTIPQGFAALLNAEELDYLARKSSITVQNESDWAPFNFNQDGMPRGFSIDYAKLLGAHIGLDVEFVSGGTWDHYQEMLKAGRLDVLLNLAITPERSAFMRFTPPYVDMAQRLYTRKGAQPIHSIEDLHGKRFAVPKGFYFHELLVKHPEIELVEVRNTTEAIQAVASGKADVLLDLVPVVNHLTEQLQVANLEEGGLVPELMAQQSIPLHLAVNKEQALLAQILAKGMSLISQKELTALKVKWLGQKPPTAAAVVLDLSQGERDWLAEHQTIRLGGDPTWPPFEQLDPLGNYAGIAAEYVQFLEQTLDVTLEPTLGLSWAEALERVRGKELDLMACVARSPKEEAPLLYTNPYLEFPVVIITREDAAFITHLSELEGRTLGVIRDGVTAQYISGEYPTFEFKTFGTVEEGLRAVRDGTIPAFVDNLASITYALGRGDIQGLKVAATTQYTFRVSFGVRDDWPELVSILNKAIDAIPKEERARIHDRWINVRFERAMDWGLVREIGLVVLVFFGGILLAIFIWNRRLAREIAERRKTERKLVEAEAKTRAMSEAVPDGLIMIDAQARIMFWNPTAERLFGYPTTEALGMSLDDIVAKAPDHERPGLGMGQFARTDAGPVVGGLAEYTATDRAGNRFPVEVSVSSFQMDGAWYIVGTVRDISDRKRTEEALRESERRHRIIFEKSPLGMILFDNQGTIVDCNDKFVALMGTERAKLIGFNTARQSAPKMRETLRLALGGEVAFYEDEYTSVTGGRSMFMRASFNPIDSQNTPTGVIATVEDISERRRMEQRLADQLTFQQALMDTIPYPVFYKGADSRFLGFNKAYEECFAVQREDLIGKRVLDLEYLPLADREQYQAEDEAVIASAGELRKEMPIPFADGKVHQTLYFVSGFRLADGSHGGLVGTFVDITERKAAEESLRLSRERMDLLISGANLGTWEYDLSTKRLEVNEVWARMLGLELEEAPGDVFAWIKRLHPEDRDRTLAELDATLEGRRETYVSEHRMLAKDGSYHWILDIGRVIVRNPDGSPLVMAGVQMDITERRTMEEQLRSNLDELQRFSRLVIGREERMIQLKQEINALLTAQGLGEKYKIVE